MTDLERLKVSLTKHNAHKIARLLKEYPASEILDRLDEVHANASQARKNLSVLPVNRLPAVWAEAQALGPDAIDALTLVGIIFSHKDLIDAMAGAADRRMFSGRIERGVHLRGKAYTNFARIIDQLGYATRLEFNGVTFDLKPLFEIPRLAPLVRQILALKLKGAGWDQSSGDLAEIRRTELHRVFGMTDAELEAWLSSEIPPAGAGSTLTNKDRSFFEGLEGPTSQQKFAFRTGHVERETDPIEISASPKATANRLHNEIQNKLYAFLKNQVDADGVGTEIDTGSGTTIDIATLVGGRLTFYEIKTASSVKACIRQALLQLLEYAYWPEDERADELVIVSHLPITAEASRYMRLLRDRFRLPISYRQFDLLTGTLRKPSRPGSL